MTETRTVIDDADDINDIEDPDELLVTTLRQGPHGEALRVEVRGDLDFYTAPSFSKALEDACSNHSKEQEGQTGNENPTTLLIDMREVRFIDSGGLAVLLHQHQQIGASCPMTLLIKPSSQVARVLKLTQIERLFTVVGSPDEYEKPLTSS